MTSHRMCSVCCSEQGPPRVPCPAFAPASLGVPRGPGPVSASLGRGGVRLSGRPAGPAASRHWLSPILPAAAPPARVALGRRGPPVTLG